MALMRFNLSLRRYEPPSGKEDAMGTITVKPNTNAYCHDCWEKIKTEETDDAFAKAQKFSRSKCSICGVQRDVILYSPSPN